VAPLSKGDPTVIHPPDEPISRTNELLSPITAVDFGGPGAACVLKESRPEQPQVEVLAESLLSSRDRVKYLREHHKSTDFQYFLDI